MYQCIHGNVPDACNQCEVDRTIVRVIGRTLGPMILGDRTDSEIMLRISQLRAFEDDQENILPHRMLYRRLRPTARYALRLNPLPRS